MTTTDAPKHSLPLLTSCAALASANPKPEAEIVRTILVTLLGKRSDPDGKTLLIYTALQKMEPEARQKALEAVRALFEVTA